MEDGGSIPSTREPRSLGWLTQSSVQPRKRRHIEGVSATSLVSLRSELATQQERVAAIREGSLDATELRKSQHKPLDISLLSNPGVAARDARDRAQIETDATRLAASAAALERKAALYERLLSGQEALPHGAAELYEVDFALKPREAPDTLSRVASAPGGMVSKDMAAERERQEWEAEVEGNRQREQEHDQQRRQRKQAIQELVQETEEARHSAEASKRASQRALAARTAALKSAYLKKQVATLKKRKVALRGKDGEESRGDSR